MAQAEVRPLPEPEIPPSKRYLNREISRFEFADRVLALAEDRHQPLLERFRFLAIWSRHVDELFQVRVAGLKEQLMAAPDVTSPDGFTPHDQLVMIRGRMEAALARQQALLSEDLLPALAEYRIHIVGPPELTRTERTFLGQMFRSQVFPILTPLAVDPAHPFPYISSLSLNLAVMLRDPERAVPRFARVKIPPVLPRFVHLPDPNRLIAVEEVVGMHLSALFPGTTILEHYPFRVTRDADLEQVDDDAGDLLLAIQQELRRQRRAAMPVRLEVDASMSAEVLDLLTRELELSPLDVYACRGMLDLSGLWQIGSLDRPELRERPWTPVTQARLRQLDERDIFTILKEGDLLVHLPYDSFVTSVEAFVNQAAHDPSVVAIKQTLYRTSGPVNPIVRSLIAAAESGKQVVALVELMARGDEQANIAWAEMLEDRGVHVVYGVVGLKTHAKTTLVLRQEEGQIRTYVHLGTGNYNPDTAQTYEDLGLFSADPDLGADVVELFNFLTGYGRQRQFRRLLVAPMNLREELLRLIRREGARPDGRVVIKLNNLADTEIVDAVYSAAMGGAEVDLICRGVCVVRPGVPGLSERIRVRSILGQFLEHSRIFRFGTPSQAEYFIGSADLMQRNLDRRVEALTPVLDPSLQRVLDQILDCCLADDTRSWQLGPDGEWHRVETVKGIHSQQRLRELALQRGSIGIADG